MCAMERGRLQRASRGEAVHTGGCSLCPAFWQEQISCQRHAVSLYMYRHINRVHVCLLCTVIF